MSRLFEDAPTEKKELWVEGVLFHRFKRYKETPEDQTVDRLIEILRHGLIAPGCDPSGKVKSDLNISVTGTEIPYDRVVFLHRYSEELSLPYVISNDSHDTFVFIDDRVAYLTPEEIGGSWPVISRDEVYARESISPEKIGAIAVPKPEIEKLSIEIQDFRVPLYDLAGQRHC
jgi:hypothetical protein